MKLTGASGPEVGRILKAVEDWILNTNPNATRDEVIEYITDLQ